MKCGRPQHGRIPCESVVDTERKLGDKQEFTVILDGTTYRALRELSKTKRKPMAALVRWGIKKALREFGGINSSKRMI